jgi:hypothetical protein|eukprot:COSAG01_NODE_11442_length_1933_cov_2.837514_1_plen_154_part_00
MITLTVAASMCYCAYVSALMLISRQHQPAIAAPVRGGGTPRQMDYMDARWTWEMAHHSSSNLRAREVRSALRPALQGVTQTIEIHGPAVHLSSGALNTNNDSSRTQIGETWNERRAKEIVQVQHPIITGKVFATLDLLATAKTIDAPRPGKKA